VPALPRLQRLELVRCELRGDPAALSDSLFVSLLPWPGAPALRVLIARDVFYYQRGCCRVPTLHGVSALLCLRELALTPSRAVLDADLDALCALPLHSLSLSGAQLADGALLRLAALTRLARLDLSSCDPGVSDDGVAALAAALTQLTALHVASSKMRVCVLSRRCAVSRSSAWRTARWRSWRPLQNCLRCAA